MPYFPPNALTMLGLPQNMQGPVQAPANLQIGGGGVALPPGMQPAGASTTQQGGGPGMIDPRVLQGGGFSQVGGIGQAAPPQANAFRQALQGALQQQQGAGAAAAGMANRIGDPKQSVQGIYQDLFGRQPDPAGLSYWANQMQTGALSPGNAAQVIAGSAQGPDMAAMQNDPQARDAALNKWFSATTPAPNFTNMIKPIDMSGWQKQIDAYGAASTNVALDKIRQKMAAGQPLDVYEQATWSQFGGGGGAPAPVPAPAPAIAPAAPAGGGLLSSGDTSMDEWRRQMANVLPNNWG